MAWDREREAFRRRESPGVLFFRVAVMLSCLILVPLAAIFGSAFPDVVKTQLVEPIKSLAGMESHPVQGSSQLTSREITALPPVSMESPRWNTAEPAPAWQPAVSPTTAHQVDYTTPAPPAEGQRPQVATPHVVDHFTDIQQRLRVYGASRYALEAVGGGGDLYRFHCQFPSPVGNSISNFEATDRDPLVAMANVLKQVEDLRQQGVNKQADFSIGFGR